MKYSIEEIVEAAQENRVIILPRNGTALYFITSGDCEKCPLRFKCCAEFKPAICPAYVDTVVWDTNKNPLFGERSQLKNLLQGTYFRTLHEAQTALMLYQDMENNLQNTFMNVIKMQKTAEEGNGQ